MDKIIYLTFDDGPNEPYTSQTLDILKTYSAKATFFVCGRNIERHPESLKKILKDGHAIGNHTYSHSRTKVLFGGKALKDEIIKTNELIKNHAGIGNTLYRSPWGLTMRWIKPWLRENNFKTYRWDVMAFDWLRPSADFIAGRIINGVKKIKAPDPIIILLHDGNQTFGGDRAQTVKALPLILESLLKQNYKFEALRNI